MNVFFVILVFITSYSCNFENLKREDVEAPIDCESKLQPSDISTNVSSEKWEYIETYFRDLLEIVLQWKIDLDEDVIPIINITSMSRSSSFASSSTGSAFSSAMARTTWTNKPKVTDDLSCGGDRNATYKDCPNFCKSTCSNPSATCVDFCTEAGCQCNALYLFSDNGSCILPDDCPGGNPCPQNETFVFCNADCPTNYCPVNDNLELIACDPLYPCPSGCACKANYKRKSLEDGRCILANDCLPVNCTRPNEEWNPCPQPCVERCTDLNKDASQCGQSTLYCDPKCFCKKGYHRNDSDICVPVASCSTEDSEF